MSRWFRALFYLWLALIILSLASRAKAADLEGRLLRVEHLSLDIHKFSANREPMTPEIEPQEYRGALQLNWDVSVGDLVRWDNKVYASGTDARFTTVSWEYMLRIPTRWGIEPFMAHKSQHVFDQEQSIYRQNSASVRFPVRDSWGVRMCFYGCK